MRTDYDVVVIGAGVIGTMTAKALAERGRTTLILERFQLGHTGGSSHGLSRIVRVTDYHPDYVRINRLAMRAWEELQEAAGETLLVRTGNLEIGEGAQVYADALETAGERFEWLTPEEALERWPALRIRAGERMFVQEDGGVCLADRTVRAAARLAVTAGAELREDTRVERIADHDTFAEVVVDGEPIRASAVVVTAGAWARTLLSGAGLDLPLVPTLEQVSYYALETPFAAADDHRLHGRRGRRPLRGPASDAAGELQARARSRRPDRRSRRAIVRARPRTPRARGGLGPEPVPLDDPDGHRPRPVSTRTRRTTTTSWIVSAPSSSARRAAGTGSRRARSSDGSWRTSRRARTRRSRSGGSSPPGPRSGPRRYDRSRRGADASASNARAALPASRCRTSRVASSSSGASSRSNAWCARSNVRDACRCARVPAGVNVRSRARRSSGSGFLRT